MRTRVTMTIPEEIVVWLDENRGNYQTRSAFVTDILSEAIDKSEE